MPHKIILAAIVALVFSTLAHAAAPASGSMVVVYGDLDLSTIAGRDELNSRLRNAAGTLCSPILAWPPDSEPSIREHQIYYKACVGRLAMRAMARIEASHSAINP